MYTHNYSAYSLMPKVFSNFVELCENRHAKNTQFLSLVKDNILTKSIFDMHTQGYIQFSASPCKHA